MKCVEGNQRALAQAWQEDRIHVCIITYDEFDKINIYCCEMSKIAALSFEQMHEKRIELMAPFMVM